nr:MAG TPA: Neck appendage protein [Caudoviricetes sp.]
MPLNAAYADEIVQENNSTYQLSFRFPTSDSLWEQLKEEAFLTADDLHGEQDFVIFEVEKKHGYIQVYANQVFTLLNNYVVSSLTLNRATGSTALSRFAGAITRDNPFSFFSDIEDRHTFNIGSKNAMEVFAKDKHSIIGQWRGDLVRHGYQVRLLKNGGSENESLFMYKKNLSSYQHKTSTKSLKTRITFKTTVKGEGEKAPDRKLSVVVDSPLINKYSQIYEDVIEVNDQDVKDEASLRKYGEQYYQTSLCDMMEDSLELEVVGQSDVPVQMFDIVSLFHDVYNLDVRKKITKYTYSPMGKKLKTVGFGQFKSGLANAIGNAVSDAVKGEAQQLQSDFERQLARELKNADLAFDRQKEELVNQFTDGLNAAKANAEEVKRELSDTINQRFSSFDNGPLQEAKRRADEALRNAGASSLLAQEAKQISEQVRRQLDSKADLVEFQRVKETNQLYERIIGRGEPDIADKVARMALTNELFQVEVAKSLGSDNNLIVRSKSMDRHTLVNEGNTKRVFVNNGIFSIRCTGNSGYTFAGFTLPLYIDRIARGETYTLNFKYRIMGRLDHNFTVVAKNHRANDASFSSNIATSSTAVSNNWQEFNETYTISRDFEFGNSDIYPLYFYLAKNGWVEIKEIMLVRASQTNGYKASQFDDMSEAVRSVQSQLAGSWAVQNLTSAGSIVSQINATNNQILIEAEKIRLKGKTLLDELTAINGYFKRLFVGEGTFAKLNAEIIGSKTITADKLIMDQAMARMFVSSDIFTDTLAAKEAFINKLRSVVVSATLLEGYKGKIGGFQIGTHDKDPHTYWLTGQNQFAVGMSNGSGDWSQTALWVNWGNDWGRPSNTAWFVKHTGQMFCYNRAHFWNDPTVYGDLIVTGNIKYYPEGKILGGAHAYWLYSGSYKKVDSSNGYMYFYAKGDNYYDWIPMNKEISDRRYKHNIKASTVSGLDIVESLKTYSYRKEYDGKIEDIACGIMAQDVQKYVPEAFYENPDGAYSYRTFELVPYLIKAVQELNQKIEKLEKTA